MSPRNEDFNKLEERVDERFKEVEGRIEKRFERVEEVMDASQRTSSEHVGNLWKVITSMKIEAAKSQVKLAMLLSVLFFVLQLAAQYLMKGK